MSRHSGTRLLRRLGLLAMTLVVVAALAPNARAAEPVKLRTSWLVVPASIAPFLPDKPDIARHLGKSYTLETIHFTGTAPMITGLAADEIDIAPLSFSAFSLAVTNGGLSGRKPPPDHPLPGKAARSWRQTGRAPCHTSIASKTGSPVRSRRSASRLASPSSAQVTSSPCMIFVPIMK